MKTRFSARPPLGALATIAWILCAAPTTAQLSPADASDAAVLRRRPVRLTRDALTRPARRETLRLELFDGRETSARLERFERTRARGFTWYGKLDSDPDGYAAFAGQDGALVGVIREGDLLYQVRGGKDGVELRQCAPESLGPCIYDEPRGGSSTPKGSFSSQVRPPLANDVTVVDVLVAWTPIAEAEAGGPAAMQALIDLAVLETNVAYIQSEVRIEMRLVHSAPVAYTESGDLKTDLERLQDPTDGFMDEVHTWRDDYGADAVSVILDDDTRCGRSYNWGAQSVESFSPWAVNVVAHSCATGYFAFAHEFGHNFGLDHDQANTRNTPTYPDAYGYHTPDGLYRTIMALSLPGGSATRIQYYSNPDVVFDGDHLGVPGSNDCARALNENAATIAGWRPTVVALKDEESQTCERGRIVIPPQEVFPGGTLTLALDDPSGEIAPATVPVLLVGQEAIGPDCSRPFRIWRAPLALEVGSPWIPGASRQMAVPIPSTATLVGSPLQVQLLLFDPFSGEIVMSAPRHVDVQGAPAATSLRGVPAGRRR